jgi:tetratricopeptide (TPR) repeat protein
MDALDPEEFQETPQPAPERRKQKLVSKVRAKMSAHKGRGGGDSRDAGDAIARAKAQVEAAKARKRVTKVKLGVPSRLRDRAKDPRALDAKDPVPKPVKRGTLKTANRVVLARGAKASAPDKEVQATDSAPKVSAKHRMRKIGRRTRDDARLRDAAASQIKAQREVLMDEGEEEETTLAIGDADDYDESSVDEEAPGGFSVSLSIADSDEDDEDDENNEIPYLEPIGHTGSSRRSRSESAAEEQPAPPQRRVQQRLPESELQAMFEEAQNHLDAGDRELAVQLFSDLIDLEDNHMLAYVARGRIFLDLGDYARAMSDFTIAHEENPDLPEPQLAIGDLYFSRKDYQRAIQYFDGALAGMPGNAMAYCRRGISHYYEHDFELALSDLHLALELDEEIPNIKTYMSMAKKKSGR